MNGLNFGPWEGHSNTRQKEGHSKTRQKVQISTGRGSWDVRKKNIFNSVIYTLLMAGFGMVWTTDNIQISSGIWIPVLGCPLYFEQQKTSRVYQKNGSRNWQIAMKDDPRKDRVLWSDNDIATYVLSGLMSPSKDEYSALNLIQLQSKKCNDSLWIF